MNATTALSIQEFNDLLRARQPIEKRTLWEVLRQISDIRTPQVIRDLLVTPTRTWS